MMEGERQTLAIGVIYDSKNHVFNSVDMTRCFFKIVILVYVKY